MKCKKNVGRNRKDKKYNKENQHDKFETTNVMTRVKRNVGNNSLDLLNTSLEKSENPRLQNIRLCKIDKSVIEVCKKEKNLDLLKTPLKDLFSSFSSAIALNLSPLRLLTSSVSLFLFCSAILSAIC